MSAAAPDTWMPLWIGPYLANTLHLNRAQHGSYCLLIMACWKAGGSLPANDDALATIARCSAKEWRAERAIFAAFFTETEDGRWEHERVIKELAKARGFIQQRSAAGIASAEARKRQRDGNDRSTSVERDGQRKGKTSPSPTPSQSTHGEIIGVAPSAPPPGGARSGAKEPLRLTGAHSIWSFRLQAHKPNDPWPADRGPAPESDQDNPHLDDDQRRQWRRHHGLPAGWRKAA